MPFHSPHQKIYIINVPSNCANIIQEESLRILTTRAVGLEIGNALAKEKYRKAGIELLSEIEEDSSTEIRHDFCIR